MMAAAERWRERVREHHTQTLRMKERSERDDFWKPIAAAFRDDPARADDPVLNALAEWVDADTTVLDVGGGAGRFAVPLAKRCRRVTVVEPSDSMIEGLRSAASDAGVSNVEVVQSSWEEAEVEAADVVLCAHVVYGVEDIEPFVRKLAESAQRRVVIVVHAKSPISLAAPFWEAVHHERRINLPALPELVPVLWEMGIWPDVRMLGPAQRRAVSDPEMALTWLRHMTWVAPGSEKDRKLTEIVEDLYDAEKGEYVLRTERPPQGIVTWVTEGND